eukprot:3991042-Pyramimonas_sp.AAC.1
MITIAVTTKPVITHAQSPKRQSPCNATAAAIDTNTSPTTATILQRGIAANSTAPHVRRPRIRKKSKTTADKL